MKAKPFMCEEFWFHIPGFIDIVREAWNTTFIGLNALPTVKEFIITDATESVTTDSQEVVGKLSR